MINYVIESRYWQFWRKPLFFKSILIVSLLIPATAGVAQELEGQHNLLADTPFSSVELLDELPEIDFDFTPEADEVDETDPEEPQYLTAEVSYYGRAFNGRRTASGLVFQNTNPEIVAHRSLPFGTRVEFRNPTTDAVHVVTVSDRGPCHGSREFDLSEAAASRLEFRQQGTARLEYRIVQLGNRPYPALNCGRYRPSQLKYG